MRFIPKKTIELIVNAQNHYVAQVKANQRKLMVHIQETVSTQVALSEFSAEEQAHGRQSSWQVRVYNAPTTKLTQAWQALACFVHVHRQRLVKGQLSQVDAYFMSDLVLSASEFAQGIRGHWGIENKLHWVKDRGRPCGGLWRRCEPHSPQDWFGQRGGIEYDLVEFASSGGPQLDYRGANKIWL